MTTPDSMREAAEKEALERVPKYEHDKGSLGYSSLKARDRELITSGFIAGAKWALEAAAKVFCDKPGTCEVPNCEGEKIRSLADSSERRERDGSHSCPNMEPECKAITGNVNPCPFCGEEWK